MAKDRRTNFQKFNHLYKLFCPNKESRFICFYCGLPAGTVDHVPALNKVEELRAVYDLQHYTKVPSCQECNGVASDEPHVDIFERRKFLKDKLRIRYKKYIKLPDWEEDEIESLGYSLRMNVESAMSIKYLIAYRLTYGEEQNIKASDLGYLQYDPRKIFKYAKAENWDKSIQKVNEKEISLKEVNERFKKIAKLRNEEKLIQKKNKKEANKLNKFSFIEARSYVRSLKLRNGQGYKEWREKNIGLHEREMLPPIPRTFYESEWKGWEDFIGNSYTSASKEFRLQSKTFLSFDEAKKLLEKHKEVRNSPTYLQFWREHKNILPSDPKQFYKNNWNGWEDFLEKNYRNKQYIKSENFLEFEQAKKLLKSFKLKNASAYSMEYQKISIDLPSVPKRHYADKWNGWDDFLGKDNKEYMSYQLLSSLVKLEGIKSKEEYLLFRNSSVQKNIIPYAPDIAYEKNWKNWKTFLGRNLGE